MDAGDEEQADKMEDDMFLRCIEANMLSDMTLQGNKSDPFLIRELIIKTYREVDSLNLKERLLQKVFSLPNYFVPWIIN